MNAFYLQRLENGHVRLSTSSLLHQHHATFHITVSNEHGIKDGSFLQTADVDVGDIQLDYCQFDTETPPPK